MAVEDTHTLVLGTGPAGLAAGYVLAKAGLRPLLLERDKVHGGLMRSVHRGEFAVDVGRKELYNRLEKVDRLWSEILGDNYRPYQHRGGILYDGHIIEMSPAYKGFRRGMPLPMLAGCAVDFFGAQLRPRSARPGNVEEYFYQRRGRRMTQFLSQGFQEKLTGRKWKEMRLADAAHENSNGGTWRMMKEVVVRSVSAKEVNTFRGLWRHPAKGTGQICDALARGITEHQGRIAYQVNIQDISVRASRVESLTATIDGETVTYRPQHVISSIPLDALLRFVAPESSQERPRVEAIPRTVVLVYLFLNEKPRFPHAWLQVTCPSSAIGRITNYAAFNGDMVPEGKTCLCCEYYCFGADPLLALDNAEIVDRALQDCARFRLVDPAKRFDHLVLRFQGADASQNRHNWLTDPRRHAMKHLGQFTNLYYVSRTDLDIATLAGVEAAEAVISGDRAQFDHHVDPTNLPIRSEAKPFEFKLPPTL